MTISIASAESSMDRAAFMEHYYAFVYVRILQALGAYGFRGFYERKAHFLQSVPYALKNLRWLAAKREAAHRVARADGGARRIAASEKLQAIAVPAAGTHACAFSASHFIAPRRGTKRATAADSCSMRADCQIPGAKNDSARSPGKMHR